MKKLKNLVLLTVLAVTMISLCGCSTYSNFVHEFFHESGEASETIKIGIIEPQTGKDSAYGNEELEGFRIANKLAPEVIGKQVELIYADTQSDMDVTEATVKELIDKKPAVVLGGYGNVVSLAASSLLGPAKIPTIGTSSTNPLIADNNDYYYRVGLAESTQGKIIADFIVDYMKLDSAVLVKVEGDETTTPMNGKFLNRMEARTDNENSVKDIIYIDQSTHDYTKYVDKIEASGVKVVFMPVGYTIAEGVFKEVDKRGLDITFIGPESWHDIEMTAIALKYPTVKIAAVSDVVHVDEANEVGDEATKNVETTSLYDKLKEEYTKAYGEVAQVPTGTALAFDAYMIAIKTISDAGSVDSEAIKAQLDKIKNYPGASGDITFNENGEAYKDLNIDMLIDKEFVTVYTGK